MLNKLLKRCMPWMDKGRWYKITLFQPDPLSDVSLTLDPIFGYDFTIKRGEMGGYLIEIQTPVNLVFVKTVFVPGVSDVYPNDAFIYGGDPGIAIISLPSVGEFWMYCKNVR